MYKRFIWRNLLLYTKDRLGIFFSFLGMFISLFIYIFFLRSNLIGEFKDIANISKFIDTWMVAGLISIVAVTSPLNAFVQKLEDMATNRLDDFIVNDNLQANKIDKLYTLTSIIEGTLSTMVFSIVCFTYLLIKYQFNVFDIRIIEVLLFNSFLVIVSSLIFSFITDFLKTTSSFSSLSAIVGTLAGFFSGTYIIYGEFPKFMQNFLNIWPGYQIAAITREKLISGINVKIPLGTLVSLGVSFEYSKSMLITGTTCLVFIILILIKDRLKSFGAFNKG